MNYRTMFFAFTAVIFISGKPAYTQVYSTDAGITGIVNLTQYSGNQNLLVYLKNFGTNTLLSVEINWIVDGSSGTGYAWNGNLPYDSVYGPVYIGSFFALAGAHTLKIFTISPNDTADENNSNDTLTVSFNLITPASPSYCESFENTLGQWQQDTADNFDWSVNSQGTPTNNSGPDAAFDGSYYIYTEASNPNQPGNAACILLHVNLTGIVNPELIFFYHMYGNQMGSLHLDAFDTIWHQDVWSLSGNQGNAWHNQAVNLSAYGGSGIVVLRFRGIIGSGSHSDMALDNVCISNVFANDMMVTSIAEPEGTICYNPAQDISVVVKNNGYTSQSDIPLTVIITWPDSSFLTLADTLAGPLAAGSSQTITFNSIDMSVPGVYSINAGTALSNDDDTTNDSLFYIVQVNPDIMSFPFFTDFEYGNNNFNLEGSTFASVSLADDDGNIALHYTGGSINQEWTGTGTTTTAANAWINNVTHHAAAYTCMVDATSLPAITLSLDLKQISPSANYFSYNWFRVLVNDTVQISDITGVSDFNPDGSNAYSDKKFNLSQYAGTLFKLSFQAAVKYNSTYDPGAHAGGDNVYIDNISLYVPPLTELALISVNNIPEEGCDLNSAQEIKISIYNNGLSTFYAGTQIPVSFSINNGIPFSENIILPDDFSNGEYIDYTFTQTADLSVNGTYNIKAWVSATGDGDLTNDTTQVITLNLADINQYPYVQDFETGTDGWYSEMITGSNTWQAGTPVQSNINSAHSGNQAWMTGLDHNYLINEHSVLNSPCFNLSGMINPCVSFWMYFRTENDWDGGILEVSADEGITWEKAGGSQPGFYNSNINYSSPQYITTPWWSGTNNGWANYSVVLGNYAGQENIRFRFRLCSDYIYTDEGFAIDDFSVSDIMVCDAGSNLQVCTGTTAQLYVTVSGGTAPYTYLWHPAESLNDSTITDPIASPASTTLYFVTVTDSNGSTFTDSVLVEIVESVPVDLGNDFNICDGESVPLGATSGNSYIWSNGETTQTIMISEAGTYSVTVDQGNGCLGISNEVIVGVNPVPLVDLGSNIQVPAGDTVTLDAGHPGAFFQWSTGETTQTINVTLTGTYSVVVSDSTGCYASDQITVTFLNNIDLPVSGIIVSIKPNPNNGKFILEINNKEKELPVNIINPEGITLVKKYFRKDQVKELFDISGWPKGVYYLIITDADMLIFKKIITL